MDVQWLLGPEGPLAAERAGRYEDRPGQRALARAIEATIAEGGVLLAEAGTGTGKTLAYLLPALLSGQRIVVSTASRALQDELWRRGLPLAERLLGEPVEAALVKGLDNYVCRRRLELWRGTGGPTEQPPAATGALLGWVEQTASGDRAELPALGEAHPLWQQVVARHEERLGPRCPFYERCFVTRARRRAEAARLVVTNHHLYLADVQLRGEGPGAQVLPEHDVVIFDEAHRLERAATQFFGVQVTRGALRRLARDLQRALRENGAGEGGVRAVETSLLEPFERLLAALLASRREARPGRIPLEPEQLRQGPGAEALGTLREAAGALEELCRARAGEQPAFAPLSRRLRALGEQLVRLEGAADGEQTAWLRTDAAGAPSGLGASPVEVGDILRERIFERLHASVLLSATLSVRGDFRYVRQRLGLPQPPRDEDGDGAPPPDAQDEPLGPEGALGVPVREIAIDSPFDFSRQVALYLPAELPEPREAGWLEAAADELRQLLALSGGGAFVLSTSVQAMRQLAERVGPSAPGPRWVQGDAPKAELLERFREAGDATLFATLSFWEGVDVPGHALRLVVLDKLPFEVPDDAVVAARLRRCRARGGNPFREEQLPAAALTLRQGFGRLVRHREDRGVVAVLDPRLRRRGYGKWLLRSLPPARRCHYFDALRAFWDEAFGSAGAVGQEPTTPPAAATAPTRVEGA